MTDRNKDVHSDELNYQLSFRISSEIHYLIKKYSVVTECTMGKFIDQACHFYIADHELDITGRSLYKKYLATPHPLLYPRDYKKTRISTYSANVILLIKENNLRILPTSVWRLQCVADAIVLHYLINKVLINPDDHIDWMDTQNISWMDHLPKELQYNG